MTSPDPKVLAQLIATHEAALALVDDLGHMRNLISSQTPSARDTRSLSNELRRILIDYGGDLRKIAPPRIGKFTLSAPDLLPIEKAAKKEPWLFITAGVADVFGISVDAWAVNPGARARPIPDYVSGREVQVRLDGFLSQKVICFQGKWVSRADVIKFVAHVGHGVHSMDPKSSQIALLKAIRHVATMSLEGDMPVLTFSPEKLRLTDKPLDVDRGALDFVLVQLLSAAMYLTRSPDIIRLEDVIRNERLP